MVKNDNKYIIEILEESDISLSIGEHELYLENSLYALSIEYSLEKGANYSFTYNYDFEIYSMLLTNLNTLEEKLITPNEEIKSTILNNAKINDWSGDYSEENFDRYIETQI